MVKVLFDLFSPQGRLVWPSPFPLGMTPWIAQFDQLNLFRFVKDLMKRKNRVAVFRDQTQATVLIKWTSNHAKVFLMGD